MCGQVRKTKGKGHCLSATDMNYGGQKNLNHPHLMKTVKTKFNDDWKNHSAFPTEIQKKVQPSSFPYQADAAHCHGMIGFTALTYALVEAGGTPLLTHIDPMNGKKDGNESVLYYSVMLENRWCISLIGYTHKSVEDFLGQLKKPVAKKK